MMRGVVTHSGPFKSCAGERTNVSAGSIRELSRYASMTDHFCNVWPKPSAIHRRLSGFQLSLRLRFRGAVVLQPTTCGTPRTCLLLWRNLRPSGLCSRSGGGRVGSGRERAWPVIPQERQHIHVYQHIRNICRADLYDFLTG
jgi:hypothetical protein